MKNKTGCEKDGFDSKTDGCCSVCEDHEYEQNANDKIITCKHTQLFALWVTLTQNL